MLWHLSRDPTNYLGALMFRTRGISWRPRDLSAMAGMLRGLLDGTGALSVLTERSPVAISSGNPIFPVMFCCAFAVLAYSGFRRYRGKRAEDGAAILARVLVVLNLSYWIFGSMVVRISDYYHFPHWQPIPQLTVAAAAHWLASRSGRGAKASAAAGLLLASSVLADLFVLKSFFAYLRTTRGEDRFSSAVYDLSDWLKRENVPKVVSLTWGLNHNLTYLSGGRLRVLPAWMPNRDYSTTDPDLRLSRPIYLVQYVRNERFCLSDFDLARKSDYLDYLASINYSCEARKNFDGARGEPVLQVLRCARTEISFR